MTSTQVRESLEMLGIQRILKSLGFGGLLGILIAYLVCLQYPQIILGSVTREYVLTFGAALGFATHRGIDNLLIKGLVSPVGRFSSYYFKVAQLNIQRRKNLIDAQDYREMKRALDREFFLGSKIQTQKLLSDIES